VSGFTLYALTAVALFTIGLYGLIARRHLVRRIIAVNFMGGGVFLLLGAGAARPAADGLVDPVPHAMVITGIVVAVSATALALTLAARITAATGSPRLPESGAPGDSGA
jgi:multicomponent Na+:H+ antiporter subunit C